MQTVGSNYQSQSVKNFNYPAVNVRLFDDSWNYKDGTSFGSGVGKYCYNDLQQKQYRSN